MEGQIALIAPLVDELARFCRNHERGDGAGGAASMLAYLRAAWPEIPTVSLPPVADDDRDREVLALSLVRDVGEVARILIEEADPARELAWSRANLVCDLERYSIVVEARG